MKYTYTLLYSISIYLNNLIHKISPLFWINYMCSRRFWTTLVCNRIIWYDKIVSYDTNIFHMEHIDFISYHTYFSLIKQCRNVSNCMIQCRIVSFQSMYYHMIHFLLYCMLYWFDVISYRLIKYYFDHIIHILLRRMAWYDFKLFE